MQTHERRLLRPSSLICTVVVVLGSCYVGEQPLSPPGAGTVDSRLNGDWRCVTSSEDRAPLLRITTMGTDRHDVRFAVPDEDEAQYFVHITRLDGVDIANVQEVRDGHPNDEWIYVRYALLREDVLDLRVVSHEQLSDVPSDEALNEIRARSANADLYEHLCVCVRTTSQASAVSNKR